MISAAENSNKFPKNQVFWKEKSVENVVTLVGPKAQATLVYIKTHTHTQSLSSILLQLILQVPAVTGNWRQNCHGTWNWPTLIVCI